MRIMKAFGLNVQGVDLAPRSSGAAGRFSDPSVCEQTVWISVSASVHFLSAEIRKRQSLNAGVY